MLALNPALENSMGAPPSSSGASQFVWKYCRMCALEVRQGVFIFGEEGKRLQIPEKIRKTVAILVLEEDTLPKKICTSCCTALESYTQFKDSVVDAQEKLASIAKSIEKSQERLHHHQQFLKSPNRSKLFHPSHSSGSSSNHTLVPAPSIIAGEVLPVEEESNDFDDNFPSVESHQEEEETLPSKPVQELTLKASVEISTRDEDIQVERSHSLEIGTVPLSPSSPLQTASDAKAVKAVSGPSRAENSGFSNEEPHLVCGQCSQAIDRGSMEDHHTKNHGKDSSEPVFGCSACPRITSNYEAIRQHLYRHRMAGTYKCADCDKTFPTKDQLHVHISSKHNPNGNKSFSCKTCGNQYSTSIALLAHQRKKHAVGEEPEIEQLPTTSTPKSPEKGKPLKKSETSALLIDLKLKKNSEEEGFWKCDTCDKIYQTKHGHDTHIATHKGRRYTCEHCGVSYTQKPTLDHHIKVHHTNLENSFECPECKKRFKTFRQLGWHKKTHERPLTDLRCPQCEKKFLNMISLKTHLKLHRNAKKYSCSQCSKSFYSRQKLDEHMNSHTGRRPIGCPAKNCTKFFSCFSNYAKHFKKHHHDQIGPKGKMIPSPNILENNNVPEKNAKSSGHNNVHLPNQSHQLNIPTYNSGSFKTHEVSSTISPSPALITPESQVPLTIINSHPPSQNQNAPRGVMETSAENPNQDQSTSPSFSTTASQTNASGTSVANSGSAYNNPHMYNASVPTFHPTTTSTAATSTQTTQESNLSVAHNNQSSTLSTTQTSHHSLPNTSPNSAHSSTQTQTSNIHQFQQPPQPQNQSVWQPVMLPSSKSYHHSSSSTSTSSLPLLSSFEILDCPSIIPTAHPSESHHNHSHNHHHQGNSLTTTGNNPASLVPVTVVVAHQAHGINSSPSSSSGAHLTSSHHPHATHSSNVHHATTSSATHSSTSHTMSSGSNLPVNVPHFVPSTQQSEPMELSYKLDSNNFQEMPMELTKVFQRDPLELCVRHEFANNGQPLMDLSSRVVNVTVGSGMNMNINGTTSTSGGANGAPTNQTHFSGGSGPSNNVLSLPYHKSVDLIERELTLNDFTGAFRQPIDLISRTDEHSHELCSEGSLVDLSLRSSFGQDQSASSFLRELIDLSSRSDSFHGEVNLTKTNSHLHNPSSHSTSGSNSSHMHNTHSVSTKPSGAHPNTSHHSNHHHHHHHHIQSHPSNNATVTLQNVIYPDLTF